jgi:hypothetical protein
MSIRSYFKRVLGGGSGGGSISTTVRNTVGIRIRTRLEAVIGRATTGIRLTLAPITAVLSQKVGIRLSTVNSGTITPQQKPAVRLSNKSSGTVKPQQTPGINIQQVTYNLVHRSGGTVATQEGGCTGRTDWANPTNAQGRASSSAVATLAGDVAGARDGILVFNYANFANKSELTITQVRLIFYCAQSGTTLSNGSHSHRYRIGGGAWVVLEGFVDDHSSVAEPGLAYDITAAITGWSDLDNLEAGVRQCCDLGEAALTGTVNAVELEVTATRTDTL